jgi:hypothetical protein
LQQCSVVLVMIDRDWLSLRDAQGRRRVDHPADYPRLEVAAALRRGIRVFRCWPARRSCPRPTGKREIALRHFNDVSSGGVVQRFVAQRQR